MTKVLDWKNADDVRDIVHLSVQALAEGHIIVMPTCTSYVAAAIATNGSAVQNLIRLAESQKAMLAHGKVFHPDVPYVALVMRHAREILDYCPQACQTAQRLAIRNWPGPTHILAPASHRDSLLTNLPASIASQVMDVNGYGRLCLPAHLSIQEIVRLSAGPLATIPLINDVNGNLAITVDSISQPSVSLAINAGATKYQGKPTVVKVRDNECQIMEAGVTSRTELQSLSRLFVMLVCTGNTCRSPMAERLLETKVNNKLSSLSSKNSVNAKRYEAFSPILAMSAGISAGGGPASPQAISAMQEFGVDLSDHQSSPVTGKEIESADLILTMTRSHLQTIITRWPNAAGKVFMLNPDGNDVGDPFGGPVSIYRDCALRINDYLDHWIDKLTSMPLPRWLED